MGENSGGKTITKRSAAVDTAGEDITFTTSVTQVLVHIEGSTAAFNYAGSDTVNSTADAQITSDGTTFTIPVGGPAGRVLGTIKAAAATIDVSYIAWR